MGTKRMRRSYFPQIALGSVVLWMIVTYVGFRLPYLHTTFSVYLRAFVVFPLLFLPLIYFGLIYRKHGGKTGFEQALDAHHEQKGRRRFVMQSFGGALLIPATVAWLSISIPACATYLLASHPFVREYRIEQITMRGGAKWSAIFDMELADRITHTQNVNLRLTRGSYENGPWTEGDDICVIGRFWLFGAIVDRTTRSLSECKSSR